MRKVLCITSLCLAALASCAPEETKVLPYDAQELSVRATIETVADGPEVVWKAEDAISLFDGEQNVRFATLEAGATATFSGVANINSEAYAALYPYNGILRRYGGKVAANLLSAQTATPGGVDPAAVLLTAKSEGTDLTMRHATAFLKVEVAKSTDVISIEVASNNSEALAGEIKLGVFDDPTVEPGPTAIGKVSISGEGLDGSYYIAVLPQTLSDGYTLTITTIDDLVCIKKVTGPVEFVRGQVYDLGSHRNPELVPAVNSNPTSIPNLSLVKASFKEADFNVVSEGGFEDYPDQPINFRSSWWHSLPAASVVAGKGPDGSTSMKIDRYVGVNWGFLDVMQVVALRPHTEYVYSLDINCNNNDWYTGSRCWAAADHLEEIPGWANAPSKDGWINASKPFNSNLSYFADLFCGIWAPEGSFVQIDNVKLVPAGYSAKSMDTDKVQTYGEKKNTTFNDINSASKQVAWRGVDGKVRVAFCNAVVGGKLYGTAIALTDDTDLKDGLTINKFQKTRGVITPVLAPAPGQAVVPNHVGVIGSKTYMQFTTVSVAADGALNPISSGFAVSDDDGLTWTEAKGKWSADSKFSEISICTKGDYHYISGFRFGRTNDHWTNMYVARVAVGKDITDPTQWDYFNGTAWVAGDENVCKNASCVICCGDGGEPALVYNEKYGRFMMIYRSEMHGGLVFRDADAVDGFWSGEKILTNDDVHGRCFAPSMVEVESDGSLTLFAPTL